MSKKMYLAYFLGIMAIIWSIIEIPALTICFVIYLLAMLSDALREAKGAPPRKLGPDQFLDDLRLANSFPRMKEMGSENTESSTNAENILDQYDRGKIEEAKESLVKSWLCDTLDQAQRNLEMDLEERHQLATGGGKKKRNR